jgi:hypothetical protein
LTDGRAIERALFSRGMPESVVQRYMCRFQAESDMVLLDLLFLDLPPSTPMLDLPVLVLGAENDSFVYRGGLDTTASTYRTRAEVFPGMAHAMMLDHGWERVAERIQGWLEATLNAVWCRRNAGSPERRPREPCRRASSGIPSRGSPCEQYTHARSPSRRPRIEILA